MYQKVIKYLTGHIDKVFHFLAGVTICLIASVFLPVWIALAAVFVAGLSKEVRDQIVYKGFDWVDLMATIIGGVFVFICLYLKGF